jgi:hypothetical protein
MAFPKHRDLVRGCEHLVELVSNQHRRAAFRGECLHRLEQLVDFGGDENGGWLIEQENTSPGRQRLGNFEPLL